MKKWLPILLSLIVCLSGCSITFDDNTIISFGDDNSDLNSEVIQNIEHENTESIVETLDIDGTYSSVKDVALYVHLYGVLPGNFITKAQARDLGWDSDTGNLWDVAPEMSIGGDTFGNREGLLPKADGRKWVECDIDYAGGFRNAKRLVFSNDGLIYYTEDHYSTFDLLYE